MSVEENKAIVRRYLDEAWIKRAGTFPGVAPTGKQLTVTAIDIARLENGKIVDHRGQMDMVGLMRQLGLIA